MKAKATQYLLFFFLTNQFQELILSFLASVNKKKSLILSILLYSFVLLINTSITYSQSGSCKASLQVEKNRNTQSVRPNGTSYTLQISNAGLSNSTYNLSSVNVNSSCSNGDGSSSSGNVNLSISFSDKNFNTISEISLSPGETASFLVNIKVPMGTSVNKWNCTEITATSTICSSYKVSTILHTLVSDPNQE